mgnify:FL=1
MIRLFWKYGFSTAALLHDWLLLQSLQEHLWSVVMLRFTIQNLLTIFLATKCESNSLWLRYILHCIIVAYVKAILQVT